MSEAYKKMILESGLYDNRFVQRYGVQSNRWSGYTWRARENYLRHQMCCLLSCNLAIQRKRKRSDARSAVPSDSSSSSISVDMGQRDEFVALEFVDDLVPDENIYQYEMIEGSSNQALFQNKMCERLGLGPKTKLYDIIDKTNKKLIEMKVVLDFKRIISKIDDYIEDEDSFLVMYNPEDLTNFISTGGHEMPGHDKVVAFLVTRRSYMNKLGIVGYELEEETNAVSEVFCSGRLNTIVDSWTSLFWSERHHRKEYGKHLEHLYNNYSKGQRPIAVEESKLKSLIEDTRLRTENFMEYKGKLLPSYICSKIVTDVDTDEEMVKLMIDNLHFPSENEICRAVNECIDKYKLMGKHWGFLDGKETLKNMPSLRFALGLGIKSKITSDDHESLKQPEYPPRPKARHSSWLSHMISEMTADSELSYFNEYVSSEIRNIHTLSSDVTKITKVFFETYNKSKLAQFASSIKNMYSRLSGAYSAAQNKRSSRQVLMFPIYSIGVDENGNKKRELFGFIIRGPSHPKRPTDRIPIITCEMVDLQYEKYHRFIKKGIKITDLNSRTWIIRQNSIQKSDLAYLTYINNSLFLSANMVGDIILEDSGVSKENLRDQAIAFIIRNKKWLLERISEGILMAVMGGSCEEGAMAIIRKIFMLKLNWNRGGDAYGWNLEGLADALNECLLESALALHMAHQIREILD